MKNKLKEEIVTKNKLEEGVDQNELEEIELFRNKLVEKEKPSEKKLE